MSLLVLFSAPEKRTIPRGSASEKGFRGITLQKLFKAEPFSTKAYKKKAEPTLCYFLSSASYLGEFSLLYSGTISFIFFTVAISSNRFEMAINSSISFDT